MPTARVTGPHPLPIDDSFPRPSRRLGTQARAHEERRVGSSLSKGSDRWCSNVRFLFRSLEFSPVLPRGLPCIARSGVSGSTNTSVMDDNGSSEATNQLSQTSLSALRSHSRNSRRCKRISQRGSNTSSRSGRGGKRGNRSSRPTRMVGCSMSSNTSRSETRGISSSRNQLHANYQYPLSSCKSFLL